MGKSGSTTVHQCTVCGAEFVQWRGKCPVCNSWNSLQACNVQRSEDAAVATPTFARRRQQRQGSWLDSSLLQDATTPQRLQDVKENNQRATRLWIPNDDEFNTVLGGGIMQGSLTLLGGDPGVGKSIASLAQPTPGIGMGYYNTSTIDAVGPVWYVSGEENAGQIASRAARLGALDVSELFLLQETHVDTLCAQVVAQSQPQTDGEGNPTITPLPLSLLVIDSIQTMVCDAGGSSAAGGVTQVRECVAQLLRLAKTTQIPIVLIGHVTKSGDVAGPRTVEHMVDCVLYLEGIQQLRMLRASKNRFGSADECGVYQMTHRLQPVSDPSSLFLQNRPILEDAEGCSVALSVEGRRAMTVEIQALVVATTGKYGRQTVNGLPYNRLSLLLGVLRKRCGVFVSPNADVYVNVVGQVSLEEKTRHKDHSSDLAVAISLVSSLQSIPVRADTAFCGQIGLLGELRPVSNMKKRLEEARRMGFSRVISAKDANEKGIRDVEWIQCKTVLEALNAGLVHPLPKRRSRVKKKKNTYAPDEVEDLGLEMMDNDEDDDETSFQ